MVIDETTKVIFLHNPKCGGTFFRDSYTACHGSHQAYDYWKLYDETVHTDLGHINLQNLPRFIPDYKEYKIISFVRDPYNRFVSGFKEAVKFIPEVRSLGERYHWNMTDICNHLTMLNYREQDFFLRNPSIPWLNPQSYYVNSDVIILHFESYNDWNFLLNIFRITGAKVHIRQDYELDNNTKKLIRDLYFDDENIFRMYEK